MLPARHRNLGPGSPDSGAELISEVVGDHQVELREEHRAEFVGRIDDLHSQMTEDELLWLEVRRNEQSHPFLDRLRPEVDGGDRWDQYKSNILGRWIPIDDVIARCNDLENAHGGFAALTESLARRVSRPVEGVLMSVMRFL